jgi:ribosome-associated protein
MLHALAESVVEETKSVNSKKNRLEGTPESGWIVIDYGSIVVHLLDEELRNYYNLEELWKAGKIILRMQ